MIWTLNAGNEVTRLTTLIESATVEGEALVVELFARLMAAELDEAELNMVATRLIADALSD